ANRRFDEVSLIAVTKTYPADDVLRLAGLGVRDLGENRDQEASAKAAAVAAAGAGVTWHFLGRLQRNKCRSVVRYADLVHSVDRIVLASALSDMAVRHRTSALGALVQVSLDGDPGRGGTVVGGTDPDTALASVLAAVDAAPGLALRGIMAVAPRDWSPDEAFEQLQSVAGFVRAEYPHASWLSAGMSGDLESAVAHGSTHVRVGSAVLGKRSALR
ncbi:MAG: YggS family pyridoxal phosphate-dependent enzyme, partial [Dactylosporangium sp.]|nr:YggS family pyridoxal phosphate-dependent enzyme [Dactylosporangium sp.]NNJ62360.1 YggS family pyridoxal phosphate-dependent enzyme [Dactylosporangium sp.]